MGHFIDDKKHIENDDNKNDDLKGHSVADKNDKNKVKINTYDKIKDIVLGKNEKIVIEKNNKNNKNNTIKKPTVDIGL